MDNNDSVAQIKRPIKEFTRVGFALSAMVLAIYVAKYPLIFLIKNCLPVLLKPPFRQWTALGLSAVCIYLIGFPIMMLLLRKIPSLKATEKKKIGPTKFLTYLVITFGAMYISNFITLLIVMILSWLKGSMLINPLESLQGGNIFANFLYGAILAPIMEEVIFRGVMVNKLRKYGDVVAILGSALAFGLIHGNISQILYAFTAGVIFAYITLRSGTIQYSILIHVLVNSLGLIVAPWVAQKQNIMLTAVLGMVVITMISVGTLLFVINFRIIRLERGTVEFSTKQLVKQLFFNWGMISYYIVSLILIVSMIVMV
ncbi:type II CAAX endopeptidase family protein [Paludicola sp. MB14-C6]|uniref:CPBP family intramembrane glutamic endopeptidase n=1 Tax=Paludihabitans sp. MB14-C6 TaxID=3070656 RepID=UPI0027DE5983|nr:type II CAAX endopeptidase family protein [Paludicola sp. MB14-C6]WMJ22298.1 type II CAAX endopeptidase family protein [Paludicola sp. MB14-C6]